MEHLGNSDQRTPNIQAIIAGIKELKPNRKQEKVKLFKALYPTIKEALDRAVPQNAVLMYLESTGLKLSPNTFRSMLASMEDSAKEGEHKLAAT